MVFIVKGCDIPISLMNELIPEHLWNFIDMCNVELDPCFDKEKFRIKIYIKSLEFCVYKHTSESIFRAICDLYNIRVR